MNYKLLLDGNLDRLSRLEFGLEGRMIQLRLWQHLVNALLKDKAFKVPVHLGFGSEALVTAVDETFGDEDQLVLTHRNAVFNMARAESLAPILAEYRESADGLGHGKLGSMNLVNPSGGITYSSSILGNNFSVACGLAFAKAIKREEGIVCVLTGDGAMEEGAFYEALVFSRTHNLRVLFVVDNNNHSMVSSIAERRCEIDLNALCSSVGSPFFQLNGNDVADYVAKMRGVRGAMVVQNGPACLEVKTALLNQHAGPTPGWPTDPLKIELNHDLLIAEAPRDPLAVLKATMGDDSYHKIINHLASNGVA
jgi:TPP-dependent pyruvate/acetoin dehydrogenase alpha subunit